MYNLLLCLSLITGFVTNENPQLTINIQNIEVLEGTINIGVFNTNETFLKQDQIFRTYVVAVAVNDTTQTIIINDLPKGVYAFILYHDKNSDGILNRNLIGVPKELFGFSNNVKPKLAKPTFEECKFSLEKDRVMQIKLRYYK